jgi:membrane protein DedA with SNARE-associated domain
MRQPSFLRQVAFPVVVFALLVAFNLFYKWANLPSPEEVVALSRFYFYRYGYIIVFAGAFLEATPVLNFYLPGSTVVILAVAYSAEGDLNVYGVLVVASVAILLAYTMNYILGKYGWYKVMLRFGLGPLVNSAHKRISQHGISWLWIVYFHPNSGAIAATAAGILQVPLPQFIMTSAAAVTFWSVFWGLISYFGASEILRFLDMRWLIPVALIWVLISILKAMKQKKEISP